MGSHYHIGNGSRSGRFPNVRFGLKADIWLREAMYALPPEADMRGATSDGPYGPIADIAQVILLPRPPVRGDLVVLTVREPLPS